MTVVFLLKAKALCWKYQKLKDMSDKSLTKDIIHQILKSLELNIYNMDYNMHKTWNFSELLILVILTSQTGDSKQDVKISCKHVEKALQELLSDEQLQRCQHFDFKEYQNPNCARYIKCHMHSHI